MVSFIGLTAWHNDFNSNLMVIKMVIEIILGLITNELWQFVYAYTLSAYAKFSMVITICVNGSCFFFWDNPCHSGSDTYQRYTFIITLTAIDKHNWPSTTFDYSRDVRYCSDATLHTFVSVINLTHVCNLPFCKVFLCAHVETCKCTNASSTCGMLYATEWILTDSKHLTCVFLTQVLISCIYA